MQLVAYGAQDIYLTGNPQITFFKVVYRRHTNFAVESIEQTPMDYELKETHEFTLILPNKYWGPGSYNKWIRVGWALKNTSIRLLPTWLKFCSQSKEFNFSDIPELIELWK